MKSLCVVASSLVALTKGEVPADCWDTDISDPSLNCLNAAPACYTDDGCSNLDSTGTWGGGYVLCSSVCNACFSNCGTATDNDATLAQTAMTKTFARTTGTTECNAGRKVTSQTDCFEGAFQSGITIAGIAGNEWHQGCIVNGGQAYWAENVRTTVTNNQMNIDGGMICYAGDAIYACASSEYGCCDGDDPTMDAAYAKTNCVGGAFYTNQEEVEKAVNNMVAAAAGMATGLLVAVIVIPIVAVILLIVCIVCCCKHCNNKGAAQA